MPEARGKEGRAMLFIRPTSLPTVAPFGATAHLLLSCAALRARAAQFLPREAAFPKSVATPDLRRSHTRGAAVDPDYQSAHLVARASRGSCSAGVAR